MSTLTDLHLAASLADFRTAEAQRLMHEYWQAWNAAHAHIWQAQKASKEQERAVGEEDRTNDNH
jgi:hypothetical protein